jgi:hypothetical protein
MTTYGALYSNGQWRITYNYELKTLYEDVGIVTFIRKRRLHWTGHINQMDDSREAKQILSVRLRV